jgi:sec-independent protein translocase protein TatC
MPFLDHLEELRWRILWSLLALVVGVVAAFIALQQFDVFKFLEGPILPYLGGNKLKYTHPADPFTVLITASFTIGIVIALPVIIYQAWAFLAPALYANEKKVVLPVIFGAISLFVSGVLLSFYVVLPKTIGWLMAIAANTDALEPMITYRDYFSFAVNMSLAFGLCFELPIVILMLALLGIVTPEFLRRYRRHAGILCIVAGAFLSPGDLIWTTILLAIPLYLLYEVSVVLTTLVYRRRRKRAAALAAEEAAANAAEAEADRSEPRRLASEPWEQDSAAHSDVAAVPPAVDAEPEDDRRPDTWGGS